MFNFTKEHYIDTSKLSQKQIYACIIKLKDMGFRYDPRLINGERYLGLDETDGDTILDWSKDIHAYYSNLEEVSLEKLMFAGVQEAFVDCYLVAQDLVYRTEGSGCFGTFICSRGTAIGTSEEHQERVEISQEEINEALDKEVSTPEAEAVCEARVSYPTGTGKLIVSEPDINGVVIVMDDSGEYRRIYKDNISPLISERDKLIDILSDFNAKGWIVTKQSAEAIVDMLMDHIK